MHHLVPDIVTLLRRPFGAQIKRGLCLMSNQMAALFLYNFILMVLLTIYFLCLFCRTNFIGLLTVHPDIMKVLFANLMHNVFLS